MDILGNVLIFFHDEYYIQHYQNIPLPPMSWFFMILEEINGVYDFIRDSGCLSPINDAFDE